MDGYNVPMLSDSGYSSNNNNNIQTHTHHHKDQMLSAGSVPATPFIYELPGSHKAISHQLTGNLKTTSSDYAAFTNCIQQSALLDQRTVDAANIDAVSLGSLCDLKFPNSPTADNSFKNISLINIEANHVLVPAKSIATNDLINDGHGVEATFSNILYAKDDIVIEAKDMPRSDAAQVTHVTHYLPLKLNNNNNNNNSGVEHKFPKATVTVTAVAATAPTTGTTTVAPAIAVSVPNSSAMTAMPYSTTVGGVTVAGGGGRSRSNRGGRGARGHANSRNGRATANRQQQQQQQQQQLQPQPAEALGSPGVASASSDYLTTNAGNNFNVTVVNNQVNSNHHNHLTDNQITTTTATTSTIIATDTANSKVITHGINNFISNNNHSQNPSASNNGIGNGNGTGNGNSTGIVAVNGSASSSSNSNNNGCSNNKSNNVQTINSIATMSQNRATVLQSVEEVTLANSPTQRPGAVIVSTCVPEGSCNSNSSSVNINLNNTNNNNKTVGSSTMSPSSIDQLKESAQQQSQPQQQQQQQLLNSSSVDCDSLSSMDDLLDDQEISEASFGEYCTLNNFNHTI
ncbi:putative uncharacterized protein DDB_G0277255 [Bactrocera dorsalis]|uniref:Uncharacterized protein n=1 Tax=Bactrocera dorsalis TaxID=27457 RepID=A0ABM3JWZ2_BACDO|nr:putative uncharacterized protein DDB_G0277255 [Bactrocera dorsalis]